MIFDALSTPASAPFAGGRNAATLTAVKALRASMDDDAPMLTATHPTSSAALRAIATMPRTRSVFLPREHGSWSLAFEPLALGLLIAPSSAGAALAVAAIAGFFARRPLKSGFGAALSPAMRGARRALAILSVAAFAAVSLAAVTAGSIAPLWPLLLAAPFGAMFVEFDRHGDGRAAAAELAGSAAFAFVPAALGTLAGMPPGAALGLAALALSRSIPAILTVRTALRLRRGQPARPWIAILAAGVATGGLAMLVRGSVVSPAAVAASAFLFARSIWIVGPLRPEWSAMAIGKFEAALGVLWVAAAAMGQQAG